MIRNFLFDWSGTLADDLGAVLNATNAIFREYGKAEMTLESFRKNFRLPFSGFYAEFLPEATDEGLESLYERFFAGLYGEIELLPGAVEILGWCRERRHPVFLLSSIKATHFDEQATRLGVRDAFDSAYVEIHDKREKIGEILRVHGLDPAETAFIGDMVHDIETARYGGVLSVALLTGYDPVEKLLPARPDLIAQDLPSLWRLLK